MLSKSAAVCQSDWAQSTLWLELVSELCKIIGDGGCTFCQNQFWALKATEATFAKHDGTAAYANLLLQPAVLESSKQQAD